MAKITPNKTSSATGHAGTIPNHRKVSVKTATVSKANALKNQETKNARALKSPHASKNIGLSKLSKKTPVVSKTASKVQTHRSAKTALASPAAHPLKDVLSELKFGRSVVEQKFIQTTINALAAHDAKLKKVSH